MSLPVVFLGPTLPADEARAVLACRVLPPARQGDLYRAVRRHAPSAVGLVDGTFQGVPAVWHREILWAMSQGVPVFGAASMGALRAAELATFGMRGVGRIVDAYVAGSWPGYDAPFEDDDEVAVIHAPAEFGHQPLSTAMTDIRETVLAAERAGLLSAAERDDLTGALKALHFGERSVGRLAQEAAALLPEARAQAFGAFLRDSAVPCKKLDALAMLRAIAANEAGAKPDFQFAETLVWHRFVMEADARALLPDDAVAALVLDELRLDPPGWRAALDAALDRAAPAGRADQLDTWRVAAGLWNRAALDGWAQANAANRASFDDMLARDAALDAARITPGVAAAMLRHLRLAGRFAPLLDRARRKAARDAARAADPAAAPLDAALEWYQMTRFGHGGADMLASMLVRQHWDSREHFEAAVTSEYLFVRTGEPS